MSVLTDLCHKQEKILSELVDITRKIREEEERLYTSKNTSPTKDGMLSRSKAAKFLGVSVYSFVSITERANPHTRLYPDFVLPGCGRRYYSLDNLKSFMECGLVNLKRKNT